MNADHTRSPLPLIVLASALGVAGIGLAAWEVGFGPLVPGALRGVLGSGLVLISLLVGVVAGQLHRRRREAAARRRRARLRRRDSPRPRAGIVAVPYDVAKKTSPAPVRGVDLWEEPSFEIVWEEPSFDGVPAQGPT